MADPAYAFPAETEWLRSYLENYQGEVFFDSAAMADMRRERVSFVSLLYVMRTKPVVDSEPNPCGARWIVEGEDEHGRLLRITLKVDVGLVRVEVMEVLRR